MLFKLVFVFFSFLYLKEIHFVLIIREYNQETNCTNHGSIFFCVLFFMRMHIFIAEHANRTGPTGAAMEKTVGHPFHVGLV